MIYCNDKNHQVAYEVLEFVSVDYKWMSVNLTIQLFPAMQEGLSSQTTWSHCLDR